jgi:hypothetical protein
MKKTKILLLALLLSVLLTGFSFATPGGHGDGGGGGGGGGVIEKTTSSMTTVKPMTAEDIKTVFTQIGPGKGPGFDSATVTLMTALLEGHEMSIRDLMTIRQTMLELQSFGTTIDRYQAGANLLLIQILDGAGQISQIVLTIVPGVGWGINAALSITRTGAEEIKKGSDISKIGGEMLLDGTINLITKGVPLGDIGDKAINKGLRGVVLASGTTSKTVQKHLLKHARKRIAAGLTTKVVNREVGGTTKALVRWSAEQASEVVQWATAQKNKGQVANLAPPASSYNELISIPAMGPTGGPVALPAGY